MDTPDKLTIKVTFSSKDPMDAEVMPVLMEQKKRAAFIRTAVFCYVKGVSTRREETPARPRPGAQDQQTTSQPQHPETDTKLDAKVSRLEKLDF